MVLVEYVPPVFSRLRVEGDADRALGAAAQRAGREAAIGGRVSIVAGSGGNLIK